MSELKELMEAGVTLDEEGHVEGFQVGKSAALLDWQHAKEDKEFRKLCRRLYERNWQRAKYARLSPEEKRKLYEYRLAWARANRERVRAIVAKTKAKNKAKILKKERERKRERRALERQKRREATVYTCEHCGSQWSPIGPFPAHPPRFCSIKCGSAFKVAERKAAGLCIDCQNPSPDRLRCRACYERIYRTRKRKTSQRRRRRV